MRLHVLAGCRALLRPAPLPSEVLATLIGPAVRPATAYWLSPHCGQFSHDFLLEDQGDARITTFAQSLCDNFGRRTTPLIVLPDLLDAADGPSAPPAEGRRAALEVLPEIWRRIPGEAMVLHAVALPEGTGGDGEEDWRAGLLPADAGGCLARLRARLGAAGIGPEAIETRLLAVSPEAPPFGALLRNALTQAIAARAPDRLAPVGFAANPGRLEEAIARLLAGWDGLGIAPAVPLGAGALDRLTVRVLDALLGCGCPVHA